MKVRAPRATTPEYVAALVQYADLLFKGGLGGKDVKRPEQVAALIEVGRDVGLADTQAIAWIAVVNGRPSIWGDGALALIRASGLLEEGYPREHFEGEGDNLTAVFTIKRVGSPERVSTFSVADAKRAKLWGKAGPWSQYPERMLMWRAKGFACRDEFADVLAGLVFQEEARDIEDAEVISVRDAAPAEPLALAGPTRPTQPQPAPVAGVTDDQLDQLADLRGLLLTSHGLSDANPDHEAEIDALWLDTLKPYQVSTARDLTAANAADLIVKLGKGQDPFTYPLGTKEAHPDDPAAPSPTPAPSPPPTD